MYKKLIEFNGGNETKAALLQGLEKLDLETYYSKHLVLVIDTSNTITLYHKNEQIDLTGAILHNRYPTAHQFMGLLFEHATANNIPVVNPINTSYAYASEKIAQMPRFARAGINIPKTALMRKEATRENEELLKNNFAFPLICKTDGMKGDQVYKIESFEALHSYAESLPPLSVFMVQEFIPNTYDLRLICTFDTYLGAIKRTAPSGSFKNNFSQGGSVELYEATPEEIAIAKQTLAVNRLDLGGVDIIHSERGPLVLEVNQGPGIDGFQSIHTDTVVMAEFARLLEQKYFSTPTE